MAIDLRTYLFQVSDHYIPTCGIPLSSDVDCCCDLPSPARITHIPIAGPCSVGCPKLDEDGLPVRASHSAGKCRQPSRSHADPKRGYAAGIGGEPSAVAGAETRTQRNERRASTADSCPVSRKGLLTSDICKFWYASTWALFIIILTALPPASRASGVGDWDPFVVQPLKVAMSESTAAVPTTPPRVRHDPPTAIDDVTRALEDTGIYETEDNALRGFVCPSPAAPNSPRPRTQVDLCLPPVEAFHKPGMFFLRSAFLVP